MHKKTSPKRYKWQDNLAFLLIVLFQTKEWFISQLQPGEMNIWVGLPENRTSTLANSWLYAGCYRVPWSCSLMPKFSATLYHEDRSSTKKWSRVAIWLNSGMVRTWRIQYEDKYILWLFTTLIESFTKLKETERWTGRRALSSSLTFATHFGRS